MAAEDDCSTHAEYFCCIAGDECSDHPLLLEWLSESRVAVVLVLRQSPAPPRPK